MIEKYAREWMKRFNAVGVARGIKTVGGKPTTDEAIVFFVRKKLPEKLFTTARLGFELIPKVIEGYVTDVVEVPEGFRVRVDDSRYRPVKGGIAVINARDSGTGTLGIVNSRGEILSNNHVLALGSTEQYNIARKGDPIIQPGSHGGGRYPDDVIGVLDRWTPLKATGLENPCPVGHGVAKIMSGLAGLLGRQGEFRYVYRYAENLYDAAVGVVTVDYDAYSIADVYFRVNGVKTERTVGEIRMKRGRTTEYTTGRIIALDVAVQVDGYIGNSTAYFVKQVAIAGYNGPFSAPGDSGSLIVTPDDDSLKATELLFAGGKASDGRDITIASPIEYIINGLDYKL